MSITPAYLARGLAKYAGRARERYSFYMYWRAAEKRARTQSAERIRDTQWRKLKAMLSYAYDTIPFHKDRFNAAGITPASIRTPADLQQIPLMTKADVRQNFPDRLVVQGKKFDEWHLGQTSGSTAESMHYIRPDNADKRGLYYSVFQRETGITNAPIVILSTPHCTAGTCSLVEDPKLHIHKIHKIPMLKHLDNMIPLPSNQKNILAPSDTYMRALVGYLQELPDCIMIVDPVYLASFVGFLNKNKTKPPAVRHIITTYELLTGSFNTLFHDAFGCEAFTQYGGSELLDVANECERHMLHVMPDNAWVEVLREGRPARPGEVGKAVLTDLGNFNMPFIRYDIGDLLEVGAGKCPCGRNTETFAACHGRTRDIIPLPAGGFVTPLQADTIFKGVRGVAFYQLVQQSFDSYRISVMPRGTDADVDTEEILKRCRKMFGDSARYAIKCVDAIKPERSLKYRFVYSEMQQVEI